MDEPDVFLQFVRKSVAPDFGLDPARSSRHILTSVTDVMGHIAFPGFAVLFQDFLL